LASERKNLVVTAVENSKEAFAWLEKNIEALAPQVRAVLGGAESACNGETFDYVVANPPYIPVSQVLPIEVRKEPEVALFGGDKAGIAIPAVFLNAATRLLKTGGFLAVEHHETQGEAIAELLAKNFNEINTINDLTGRVRFTTARKA
jgi:release factor glutamine methyltransferase